MKQNVNLIQLKANDFVSKESQNITENKGKRKKNKIKQTEKQTEIKAFYDTSYPLIKR